MKPNAGRAGDGTPVGNVASGRSRPVARPRRPTTHGTSWSPCAPRDAATQDIAGRAAGTHSSSVLAALRSVSVTVRYESPWPLLLAICGAVGTVGGMVPLARPDVAIGWVALLPIGVLATAVAVIAVAAMGRRPGSPPVDIIAERSLLRLGIGTLAAGLLSSWLALAVYPGVALQVVGIASGIGLLVVGALVLGWHATVRTERPARGHTKPEGTG